MGFRSWVQAQISTPEQYQEHLRKYGWRVYLFQMSLVNSAYNSRRSLLMYYVTVAFSYCLLLYHVFCYVSTSVAAYKIGRPDIAVANVHSIILAVFILCVTTSYVVDKRRILSIEEKYLEKLFVYDGDPEESPKTIFELLMDHLGFIGIFSGGCFLFVTVYIVAPLIDARYWQEDCLKENINFCIALPMYHPYESDRGYYFYISIIVQSFLGIYRISVFCSVQITLVLWPGHLIRELLNLKHSLEHLEDRIKKRYFVTTQKHLTDKNYSSMYKNKEFNDCANFCLEENVKHHQNIIEYFNRVNDITALPSFLAYMTGTITMAIAMVKLLSVEGDTTTGANIAYVVVLGAEIGFMVIISVVGQEVIDVSEEIFDIVSHLPIQHYGLEFRKTVSIFMLGTLKPVALTSSKFNKCNHEAFGNVMNASYSFYNVSSASK